MRFSIKLSGQTLYTAMRKCAYAPHKGGQQLAFHRFLRRARYPKFHIYATVSQDRQSVHINLHLDQKRPSYKGNHAHAAEYDGPVVEAEAARIQSFFSESAKLGS